MTGKDDRTRFLKKKKTPVAENWAYLPNFELE